MCEIAGTSSNRVFTRESTLCKPYGVDSKGIIGDGCSCYGNATDAAVALKRLCRGMSSLTSLFGRTLPPSGGQALCRHQVGQPQQQHQPLRVLSQPSVADLGVTKVPLHVQERMLHLRPDRRLPPLLKRLIASRLQLPSPTGPHCQSPGSIGHSSPGSLSHPVGR